MLSLSQQVKVFFHLIDCFGQIFEDCGYFLFFAGHKVGYLLQLVLCEAFLVSELIQRKVVEENIEGVFKIGL